MLYCEMNRYDDQTGEIGEGGQQFQRFKTERWMCVALVQAGDVESGGALEEKRLP